MKSTLSRETSGNKEIVSISILFCLVCKKKNEQRYKISEPRERSVTTCALLIRSCLPSCKKEMSHFNYQCVHVLCHIHLSSVSGMSFEPLRIPRSAEAILLCQKSTSTCHCCQCYGVGFVCLGEEPGCKIITSMYIWLTVSFNPLAPRGRIYPPKIASFPHCLKSLCWIVWQETHIIWMKMSFLFVCLVQSQKYIAFVKTFCFMFLQKLKNYEVFQIL